MSHKEVTTGEIGKAVVEFLEPKITADEPMKVRRKKLNIEPRKAVSAADVDQIVKEKQSKKQRNKIEPKNNRQRKLLVKKARNQRKMEGKI